MYCFKGIGLSLENARHVSRLKAIRPSPKGEEIDVTLEIINARYDISYTHFAVDKLPREMGPRKLGECLIFELSVENANRHIIDTDSTKMKNDTNNSPNIFRNAIHAYLSRRQN